MNSKFLILWLFIVGFITISCNTHQNKTPEGKVDKSLSLSLAEKAELVESKQKIIHYDLFNEDSVVGIYHILYRSQENGRIVTTYPVTDGKGKDTICYACQDVVLTITKNGKDILLNRKIQRDDFATFIPKNEISNYSLSNFSIKEVRNNETVFYISFCIPETDICYLFELIVSDNGSFKIKEELEKESDM